MASDLSSGCTDDIQLFDEKEEGEISLEDVSSSEESHPNYRSSFHATGRCPVCPAAQQCTPWCTNAKAMRKIRSKRDAANGKENRQIKDSSSSLLKPISSTLQEKNDDLVPISSDSDMEIVGLPGNSKQVAMCLSSKTAKVRKKKKKKRSHSSVVRVEEMTSPTEIETYLIEVPLVKTVRPSKSRHGEPSSPHYSVRSPPVERPLARSPCRRYRARPLRSRSPLRRSRSPLARTETTEKKSPRKFRSPHRPAVDRRSPTRTSAKTSLASREHGAPLSQTHIDIELLKKVRRLDSIGTGSPKNKLSRNKEPSSLKEKLSNMMKNHIEPSQEKPAARTKENTNLQKDNNDTEAAGVASVKMVDDEDDIDLLRRLALETKQKRLANKTEQPVKVNSEINANNANENLNDDNDNEAYELRLIALRSAILKNHENRVKRGVKPKRRRKSKTRVESPFGKSFLEDIPIPSDDEDSRPATPEIKSPTIGNNENATSNHPEDMDLDTDVEREKEKDSMPYSPTDDVTRQIAVGAEMENDEFYDNNNEYSFQHCENSHERQNNLTISGYIEGLDTPYSPSEPTKTPMIRKLPDSGNNKVTPRSPYVSDYERGIDTPYSPPSPNKAPILDKLSRATNNERIPDAMDSSDYEPGIDTPYSPTKPNETPTTTNVSSRNNANITETPYSPTDTPICDLEIASPSPTTSLKLFNDAENRRFNDFEDKFKNSVVRNLASSMLNVTQDDNDDDESTKKQMQICTSTFSSQDDKIESALFIGEPNKTIEAIRTIDKLPDIDLDGSPLVPLSKEHEASEVVIPLEISPERIQLADEPLYLQGVPDVTKDSNKIPTLVNRTLVPASILKSNKNLQQPLPPKKLDNHVEPSFKSANMRPVSVEESAVKPSVLFKPIKLCPVPKKPQVMTTTAAAFNTSYDDSVRENKSDDEAVIVEIPEKVDDPVIETKAKSPQPEKSHKSDGDSGRKDKRKRLPQRSKRKRKSTGGRIEPPGSTRPATTKNESSTSAKNRTTRSSLNSPISRSSENSKDASSRRSKNGQTKASSSKSDRSSARDEQTTISIDSTPEKPAKKNRRERRIMRKIEASQNESGSRSENHSKSIKDSSAGEGMSSGVMRVKSPSPNIVPKNIDQISIETSNKNKDVENSSQTKEQSVKIDEAEKMRRCSLDDDEEALRALLLASLPKRQKLAEVPSTSANPVVNLPRLSDSTSTDTSADNPAKKFTPKETTPSFSDPVFTPLNPLTLSSQSSSASTTTPAQTEVPSATTPAQTEVARALPKNISVARTILLSDSSSVESLSPRKRVNVVPPKGPPKKIVKKALPVITSTKVVNNAKKYQNAMLQKKLNLQRAALIYSAQNGGSRNITLNNIKSNEIARPSSPKITTAAKMQRLIINLGSDTDTESEQESPPSSSMSVDVATEARKPLAIPTTDFEKSVVQFLKDQRKKLESVAVVKTSTNSTTATTKSPAPSTSTGNLTGLYSTPLAVRRHLPMSQQEEYRRLKQQIMERERQKLQKTIETGAVLQNRNSRSPCTTPGPLSPASPIAAVQRLDNQKVSSVPSQVASNAPIVSVVASNKDNILENNIVLQQKMSLSKSNDKPSIPNVTKVPAKVTQAIPNKPLTKLTTLSKVNSINPMVASISPKASTSRVPEKVLPKVNTVPSLPKISTNTSTPKVAVKIGQVSSNFAINHLSSKATLPIVKSNIVPTKEIRRNSGTPEIPNIPMNTFTESSTDLLIGKSHWSLGTNSLPSSSSMRRSSAPPTVRTSLHHTEMLTIQIPNDKIRTEKLTSMENSCNLSNSPTMGRQPVGTLRVLTKEQLNNRFVQIQVKQGPAGRQVTFGSASANPNVFAQSSRSAVLNIFPERSDKTNNKTMCCDNSLIFNETNKADTVSIESANDAGRTVIDDTVANSEASTLVISRNESNSRNETNFDSTASTFVMVYTDPEKRVNLKSMKDKSGENSSPLNVKPNKAQAKEVWEKLKTDVRNELEILQRLPINEQEMLLKESQENLVAKRNMVLEDLTDMSGCLRQWEVEREKQTKLIAEVRRLREQLKSAEEKLHEQRRHMNGMSPKVMEAREKINHGRLECYKLSRICQGLGTRIIGEDYKVPSTGAQLLNERLKEVAIRTGQLSKKKVPSIKTPSHIHDENSVMSSSFENVLLSDSSLVERPLHASIGQIDSDDYGDTRENPVFSDLSNATVHDLGGGIENRSPIDDRLYIVENDIEDLNSSEIIASTIGTENSILSHEICQAKENTDESSSYIEKCGNLKKNESTSLETITSSTPKASAKESIEYISLPGTSRSEPPSAQISTMAQQESTSTVKKVVDPYQSVLTHLKIPRNENPGGILCPYELMGTCNDGDCQFYHLDPRHCQ